MVDFVQSPLFDNWFEGKIPSKHLVICSPYIKEDAIRTIFEQFKISSSTSVNVDIFTTGRPEVFVSGSSDISAIRLLSNIPTVTVYLIDNIHMKAYCIDDMILLVGSGNCTSPGLMASGNVEAGISSTEKDVIAQFTKYCERIMPFAKILSAPEEMEEFYDSLSEFQQIVREELQIDSESETKIKRLGSIRYQTHRYIVKGTNMSRSKPLPWTIESDAQNRRFVSIINKSLNPVNLTPEVAYLLGGIVAGNASTWSYRGVSYNDFTVKQNNIPGDMAFIERLSAHSMYVSEIAMSIEPDIKFQNAKACGLNKIFGTHVGFSLLFKAENNGSYKETILKSILNADTHIIRAFLVGVFDSRGYVDKNFGYIAIDISDDDIVGPLTSMMTKCNIKDHNFNPQRERNENKGTPRKPQLRVKLRDFFLNIGLISPEKISSAKQYKELQREGLITDPLLPGLQKI